MEKSFSIKNFWKKRISLFQVENNLNRYPGIRRFIPNEFIKNSFIKPPYFSHPLIIWLYKANSYKNALDLLNQELKDLSYEDSVQNGIQKMLDDGEQESFYSFLSELAVLYYFYKKGFKVKFLDYQGKNKAKSPDILVEDGPSELYIEVYTPTKFYFRLQKTSEILKEIDANIYIDRRLFLKSFPNDINEEKINDVIDSVLTELNKIKTQPKFKDKHNIILYEEENIRIYYQTNKDNLETYNPDVNFNATGLPEETANIILKEIKQKADLGQLANFSPNIFAVNFLFNEDWQYLQDLRVENGRYKYDFSRFPDYIDSVYFFANGINEEINNITPVYRNEEKKFEIKQFLDK